VAGIAGEPRPAWVQAAVAAGVIVAVVALYLLTLWLLSGHSKPDQGHSANARDTVYFSVHGGFLVFAAVSGFFAGKWLNGLGFAYATLTAVTVLVLMVGAQIGSHSLACNGHNDLIRHWAC
jgi:hypothetical protein